MCCKCRKPDVLRHIKCLRTSAKFSSQIWLSGLFAFLVFLPLSFAYSYPPHALVQSHNDLLAASLLGDDCLNRSSPTYSDPVICAEMELLTIYPSVDNSISADNESWILWRYAYDASSQDSTYTDAHGCTSYYHKTFQWAEYSANFSFHFRNQSYSVVSTENPKSIPFPSDTLNESQGDNITIVLEGKIVFRYRFDHTVSSWVCVNNSCSCEETVYPSEAFNITRDLESNLSYIVEAGSPLHFLNKPVLYEQWKGDPQFEDLVFSKRRFYLASLSLENSTYANASIYEFNITNVSSDAWRIVSTPVYNSTNMGMEEIPNFSIPVPLEDANDSFTYLYVFDSNPDFLGPHNYTLNFTDMFGNRFSKKFNITTRLLTLGNSTGEDGSQDISDRSLYRPSSPIQEKGFSFITVSLGALGFLILAMLVLRK